LIIKRRIVFLQNEAMKNDETLVQAIIDEEKAKKKADEEKNALS
jgi:hypothetical protein